jgi:hypothetical protein
VKPYEFRMEAVAHGGFDVASHNVELDIDELLYKRIKRCQAVILELDNDGARPYCLEIWHGFYAYEQSWDDSLDEVVNGAGVRSECEMIRVMDNEILLTHHSKYHDGVYWETDILPMHKLDDHFTKKGKTRK